MDTGGSEESHPPPPTPGWYPVPNEPTYERYWDGQRWTTQRYWGLTAGPSTGPPGGALPPPPPPPRSAPPVGPGLRSAVVAAPRRFYAFTTLIVPPIFVFVCVLVAVAELPSHAGRVAGILAAVLAVLLLILFLRRPYVAEASPDGSIVFRAIAGSKVTTVSRITRIGLTTGGRAGSSWVFHFDDTKAVMGDIGGKGLARYVIECNPDVPHPRPLFGW